MDHDKIVFLIGPSKSGKTTTIGKIISHLSNYKISTIKYTHHPNFTIDPKGKDTRTHRDAGSLFTIFVAPLETAVLINQEERQSFESVMETVRILPKIELLLVESYNQPPKGSKIILCGNSEQDFIKYSKPIDISDVIAISSYTLSTWMNLPTFNPQIHEELNTLCDLLITDNGTAQRKQ